MPQNHALIKEPLKVQDRPLDFNVAGDKKFIDVASDSTQQLWFKKLRPVQFCHRINSGYTKKSSEKAIK